jgi:hypothetical protein
VSLTRRKAFHGPERPEHWQWSPTYQLSPRRLIDHDTEVKIAGLRGEASWFRFVCHVINPDKPAEWIDVMGPTGYRSFRPDQITKTRKIRKRGVTR